MAAGLWVQEGAGRGTWFVLPAAEVVLGRDLDADVPLADAQASRRHAALVPGADGLRLRDLGSRNGTRVNGVPETDAFLRDGDRIRIGRTLFVYRSDLPAVGADESVLVTLGRTTNAGFPPQAADRPSPPAAEVSSADAGPPNDSPRTGPARAAAPGPPFAPPPPDLFGDSPAMREVYAWIRRAAPVDSPVLIRGETGTGKELVARAIHSGGSRRDLPFVALNCAAVPADLFESELFGHARGAFTGAFAARKGLVELAHGGTLFLDEIGECPASAQAKLLRVLDTREVHPVGADRPVAVDFRLLAATHQDLATRVAEDRFRSDLLYRIRVLEIVLPPLRERPDDIPLLAMHFLDEFRVHHPAVKAFSPAASSVLQRARWPGNVRELRNAVERAVLVAAGPLVQPDDLPLEVRADASALDAGAGDATLLKEVERRHVLRILRMAGGNKSRAAQMLGIDRGTLYHRLREYGEE